MVTIFQNYTWNEGDDKDSENIKTLYIHTVKQKQIFI